MTDEINQSIGSRAGIDDSDFTVIKWPRYQLKIALVFILCLDALLFAAIGWFAGK